MLLIHEQDIFRTMEVFFSKLSEVLKDYELFDAMGKHLISMIGAAIEGPLITMILKDVIAVAAPVCETADEDQELFLHLLERGEQFVEKMKELQFFSQAAKLLFTIDTNTIFVTRRCFAIVSRANKLINETYEKLSSVGVEDNEEMNIDTIANALGIANQLRDLHKNDIERLWTRNGESQFPSFFAFQKCLVR